MCFLMVGSATITPRTCILSAVEAHVYRGRAFNVNSGDLLSKQNTWTVHCSRLEPPLHDQ